MVVYHEGPSVGIQRMHMHGRGFGAKASPPRRKKMMMGVDVGESMSSSSPGGQHTSQCVFRRHGQKTYGMGGIEGWYHRRGKHKR